MFDFNKILESLTSSPAAKGFLGGVAGSVVTNALTGKKTGKKLLKYGGMAAVGALAWKAYKDYSEKQAQSNQPEQQQWNGLEEQNFHNLDGNNANQEQPLHILKCMVAAAMSDGHIDSNEYRNIIAKADDFGLTGEDKNMVFAEISNPMDIHQVIQSTNSPELAMEVYTASVFAIDENRAEGKQYLHNLATGLQLPPPLVDAVHRQMNSL